MLTLTFTISQKKRLNHEWKLHTLPFFTSICQILVMWLCLVWREGKCMPGKSGTSERLVKQEGWNGNLPVMPFRVNNALREAAVMWKERKLRKQEEEPQSRMGKLNFSSRALCLAWFVLWLLRLCFNMGYLLLMYSLSREDYGFLRHKFILSVMLS